MVYIQKNKMASASSTADVLSVIIERVCEASDKNEEAGVVVFNISKLINKNGNYLWLILCMRTYRYKNG